MLCYSQALFSMCNYSESKNVLEIEFYFPLQQISKKLHELKFQEYIMFQKYLSACKICEFKQDQYYEINGNGACENMEPLRIIFYQGLRYDTDG